MLAWRDWFHPNTAVGTLFLPMTLETAVRLRRSGAAPPGLSSEERATREGGASRAPLRQSWEQSSPGLRQGVILGLVLGASVLVNQESAVLAVLLAAAALLPWLARHPGRLPVLAAGALAAVVVASPPLIAMAPQAASGGASISAAQLAGNYGTYGAGRPGLFAPPPPVGHLRVHA